MSQFPDSETSKPKTGKMQRPGNTTKQNTDIQNHGNTKTRNHRDTETRNHENTESRNLGDTESRNRHKKTKIEACVASVAAAVAAERGGADRIELNAALELDGLTPSLGLFNQVKAACNLPIIVMIRPRAFGFVYSDAEFAAMLEDIDLFLSAGADGIATGILNDDLTVDAERTRTVVQRMGDKPVVFHRAFDVTPSLPDALETLIECGVQRVLTSGGQPTAPEGIAQLRALVEQAAGRIEILPGSGIKPDNAAALIKQTGCTQLHGTFRAPASSMKVEGLDVLRAMPPAGTDAGVVEEIRRVLQHVR